MEIKRRSSFSMHTGGVVALEFRPEPGLLMSCAEFWDERRDDEVREVKVWATNGAVRFKVRSGRQLGGSTLSADGALLATGTGDGRVRLYAVGQRRRPVKVLAVPSLIATPLFAPDGRWLAVGGSFGGVDLFAADGSTRVHSLATDAVGVIAFSPDGALLAVGEQFGLVRLCEPAAGTSRILGAHEAHVYCAAFSPDNRTLITASVDRVVKAWRLSGRRGSVSAVVEPRVLCLAFVPNGRGLVIGDDGGWLRLRGSITGRDRAAVDTGSEVSAVAVAPAGEWFATGDYSGRVTCWEVG